MERTSLAFDRVFDSTDAPRTDGNAENLALRTENLALRADLSALKGERESLIAKWRKQAVDTLSAIEPWSPAHGHGSQRQLYELHARGRAEMLNACADELVAALKGENAR